MTCQSCQTWNTDDERRCRRCGRLLQDMPGTSPGRSFVLAGGAATAPALQREAEPAAEARPAGKTAPAQPALFESSPEARVIPFHSLTSPRERQAIQQRAEVQSHARVTSRPAERPQASRQPKAESPGARVARVRAQRASNPRSMGQNQQSFHFADEHEQAAPPAPVISCDAVAAPPAVRLQAALIDALCILAAACLAMAPILLWARPLPLDRWTLGWIATVLVSVFAAYQLVWIICGADSVGERSLRLSLVSFDGSRPSVAVRYRRLFAMAVSILAAGVGLLWALLDEDRLTWHDHMSGTFPALGED